MDLFPGCLLCLLFTWLLLRLFNLTTKCRKPLPPGPPRIPIVGNLFDLGDKPHVSLSNLAKIHGPIMSLKLVSLTTVVISSASIAKEVLQKQDLVFANRTVVDAVRAHNHHQFGLPWMPVSPLWRALRKVCGSLILTTQKLDSNQHLRRRKIQQLVEIVRENSAAGTAVNIGRAAFNTTLNLLSNTVFSVDLVDPHSETAQEFKETVWGVMEEAGKPNLADYAPLLRLIDPQGIRRRLTTHFGKLLQMFDEMFEERLRVRKENGSSGRNDLLEALIDIVEDRTEEINRNCISHLVLVLFLAGTDTTSSTLEWAMAELLRNPNVLQKARAELEQVIGRGNRVEESDIARLPYLRAIVKETFRLHASVPLLLPRKAGAEVDICGFRVPKDAQVLVNAWAIGRDENIWENAESFVPGRFLGSEIDVKGRDFELIPFGGGRRICPGLPLAMRMLHLMLASLLLSFDWKLEDGVNPENMSMEEKFGVTLQKAKPLLALPISL